MIQQHINTQVTVKVQSHIHAFHSTQDVFSVMLIIETMLLELFMSVETKTHTYLCC